MNAARRPTSLQFATRITLTAVFVVLTVVGFAVGRPVVGVVWLGFAIVSICLFVGQHRARTRT